LVLEARSVKKAIGYQLKKKANETIQHNSGPGLGGLKERKGVSPAWYDLLDGCPK
jgi:hypothetical protein